MNKLSKDEYINQLEIELFLLKLKKEKRKENKIQQQLSNYTITGKLLASL